MSDRPESSQTVAGILRQLREAGRRVELAIAARDWDGAAREDAALADALGPLEDTISRARERLAPDELASLAECLVAVQDCYEKVLPTLRRERDETAGSLRGMRSARRVASSYLDAAEL